MKDIRKILEKAAGEAAEVILRKRSEGFDVRQKSYRDLVTDCDIASEKAIISVLREEFPGSAFEAEESGYTGGENWLWVIDPIDGTHNFVYGLNNYGISIGGVRDNQFKVGLVYFPETGDSFFASKGEGSYKNGQRITVSGRDRLEQAMIAYDNQFQNHPLMMKNFKPVVDACFTVRILGSAVSDLCNVAQGVLDARIFHKPKFVDVAAGVLIVEEAGGRVTDINGKDATPDSTSIIASNGLIHQSLLGVLAKD